MRASTSPVELLARSIGWTRSALEVAASTDPQTPTPCRDWDLDQLLGHMSDGLDAFTEASRGMVDVTPRILARDPVADLCTKACALLEAWTSSSADSVQVHDLDLSADVLLHAAAVEITVHGWDVARACGLDEPLPADLAAALIPAAMLLVARADRSGRFDPPLPGKYDDPADVLLSHLGRSPA